MRTQGSVGWAFGRSKPFVDLRQSFRGLFPGSGDLSLRARYSGVDVVNFYGLGNETEREGRPSRFFKVDQGQFVTTATVSFGDGEKTELAIGPVFKRTTSDTTVTGRGFVAEQQPYGSGTFLQLGVQASLDLDGRDHPTWPTRGYHLTAGTAYYPEVLDLESYVVEEIGRASCRERV